MRARVLPHNSYGGATAGSIVEVEPAELERVPWCLEAADEVELEAPAAPVAAPAAASDEIPRQAPATDAEAPTPSAPLATAPSSGGRRRKETNG